MTAVATIIAFAGLIVFHEFGHFLVARLTGMKVERFSVGFGPALLKKQVGETEYALCALPLGGYVKIAGMEPQEDGAETDPRAYNNKPAWQRFLVILAGPFANYVMAAALFAIVLMIGSPEPDTSRAVIGDLMPDKPAMVAGLQKGDRILSVEGTKITDWKSFQEAIYARPGEATDLKVDRDGKTLDVEITPEKTDLEGKSVGMIGVVPATKTAPGVPFPEAVSRGVQATVDWNVRIVHALGQLFKGSQQARLEGPVAIVKRTSEAAQEGLVPLLLLVAVISVHLALFNLFPIPALDGGRLVFLGAEVVRRKPVNARFEMAVHAVGFLLLIGLMILVTVGDVRNLFKSDEPVEPARTEETAPAGQAAPAGPAAPAEKAAPAEQAAPVDRAAPAEKDEDGGSASSKSTAAPKAGEAPAQQPVAPAQP